MATTSSLGAVVQSRGLAGCLTRTAWATVVRSHSRSWTAVRKPEQLVGAAQLCCPAAHAQGPQEHELLRACLKRPCSARRLRPLMNNQYSRHSTVPASSLLDVPGRDVHPVGARRPGQRPSRPWPGWLVSRWTRCAPFSWIREVPCAAADFNHNPYGVGSMTIKRSSPEAALSRSAKSLVPPGPSPASPFQTMMACGRSSIARAIAMIRLFVCV